MSRPKKSKGAKKPAWSLKDVENVPLLRPTMADMENFGKFVESIADDLDKFGAVNVQPPADWKPPKLDFPDDCVVPFKMQLMPWTLLEKNKRGDFEIAAFQNAKETVLLRDFRNAAKELDPELAADAGLPVGPLAGETDAEIRLAEEKFWQIHANGLQGQTVAVKYGTDIIHPDPDERDRRRRADRSANMPGAHNHVTAVNQYGVLRHLPAMEGITRAMFYIGRLFTRFCWHVEDAYFNSISYLRPFGSAKLWYTIPPGQWQMFEKYAEKQLAVLGMKPGQPIEWSLKYKTTMFHPVELMKAGITVGRVVQRPGTITVTAPRAHHCGFNLGFNIAEAVNYAGPQWFPLGRKSSTNMRVIRSQSVVSVEWLLFREATALAVAARAVGVEKVTEQPRVAGDALTIARELWHYVTKACADVQKFAHRHGVRVISWREAREACESQGYFDDNGYYQGVICKTCDYQAYFFALICLQCASTKEAKPRCVEHMGQSACRKPGHERVIVRMHDAQLTLTLLEHLEKTAGKKINKLSDEERRMRLCSYSQPEKVGKKKKKRPRTS